MSFDISACDVYIITDRELLKGFGLEEWALRLLKAGARVIQYRDKEASKHFFYHQALSLREITRNWGARLIINDYLDVALAVKADGLHLGQEDLPCEVARGLLGRERLLGISTHSLQEALKAQEEGADYVGFGPVFPTTSKKSSPDAVGLSLIREVSHRLKIPFFAIGGINTHNVHEVVKAGARNIAVISALAGAEDPAQAYKELVKKLTHTKAHLMEARA